MYQRQSLNSYYFKAKVFYFLYIPIRAPYRYIDSMATDAGTKLRNEFDCIIESPKLLGFGWIGIEVEKPKEPRNDVVPIAGEFEVFDYVGPYKTLGKAHKKISQDRPNAKERYNFYFDDPHKTPPEKCRTKIFFRDLSKN